MIQLRIDDVRPHMSDNEHEALYILCSQNLVEVLLAFTPLWLDAKHLGRPDLYSQEIQPVTARAESIDAISQLIKHSNVRLGMHGLYHYYRISNYRKLRFGYTKKTRNFDPEWKYIDGVAFERDIKIGSKIIQNYFGIPPSFISPPSNALSRSARKYCNAQGIDLRFPRRPLVNDFLAKYCIGGGGLKPLFGFVPEIYIPLYHEAAVDKFIESCSEDLIKNSSIVLLLHPWEMKLEAYRNIINYLCAIFSPQHEEKNEELLQEK